MAKQTTLSVLFKNNLRDTSLSLSYIALAMRLRDASPHLVLFEFGSFQGLFEMPLRVINGFNFQGGWHSKYTAMMNYFKITTPHFRHKSHHHNIRT